jgi:hypothetical protein
MRSDLYRCDSCGHTVSKDTLEYNDRYWKEDPRGAFMGKDVHVGGDRPSFNQVCPECVAENSFKPYDYEDQVACQKCGGIINPGDDVEPEAMCSCEEPTYPEGVDDTDEAVERALDNWE